MKNPPRPVAKPPTAPSWRWSRAMTRSAWSRSPWACSSALAATSWAGSKGPLPSMPTSRRRSTSRVAAPGEPSLGRQRGALERAGVLRLAQLRGGRVRCLDRLVPAPTQDAHWFPPLSLTSLLRGFGRRRRHRMPPASPVAPSYPVDGATGPHATASVPSRRVAPWRDENDARHRSSACRCRTCAVTARPSSGACYGSDVIPMWIAEMDCAPCPAVVDAVSAAVSRGDTGYAADAGVCRRGRRVRRGRVGVGLRSADDDPRGRRPDRRDPPARPLHRRGWPGRRQPAGLQRLLRGHRGVRTPGRRGAARGRTTASTSTVSPRCSPRLTAEGAADGIPALQPAQPDGHGAHPGRARGARRASPTSTACAWSPTRSTARSCCRRAPSRPTSPSPGTERGITVTSASKAWNLAGLKAAIIVPGDAAVDDVAPAAPLRHLRREPPGRHRADGGLPRRSRVGAPARRRARRQPAPARRARRGAPARRPSRRAGVDLPRVARPRRRSASATTLRARCCAARRVALSPGPIFGSGGRRARCGSTTPRHPRSSARRSARIASILD